MSVGKKRAAKAARELLSKFNVTSPPVNVESIAKQLDISILKTPQTEADLSGFLVRERNKTIVGINSAHDRKRQRFTIAHELGHYCLHRIVGVHVDRVKYRNSRSSAGTDFEEIEANAFAAELLMPSDFIRREMKQYSFIDLIGPDATVESLANKFEVSTQAMTIRLANLGYIEM